MNKENNRRRFPGESSRNRPDRAAQRRNEAAERQAISDGLSPQQRLEKLDMKFGNGLGAKSERKRLQLAVENRKTVSTDIDNLDKQQLPDEVMQEIAALNDEGAGKKRLKAKDRRAKEKRD